MPYPIRIFIHEYGWVHLALGLAGNVMFFVGSVLFLPAFQDLKSVAVWLFIAGSFLMMIGSFGRLIVDLFADE